MGPPPPLCVVWVGGGVVGSAGSNIVGCYPYVRKYNPRFACKAYHVLGHFRHTKQSRLVVTRESSHGHNRNLRAER